MFLNPELQLTIAHDRQRELIAEQESADILSAARRHRARRGKVRRVTPIRRTRVTGALGSQP